MARITWDKWGKPTVGQWYRLTDTDTDYIKITRDFYNPERRQCYYKIVTYYDGTVLEYGLTLEQARQVIRELTWRESVDNG